MYLHTREYVNNKFVRPVLLRAGSVKQIGSQAANAAADRLDDALTVADKYMDRYLPADPADKLVNGKRATLTMMVHDFKEIHFDKIFTNSCSQESVNHCVRYTHQF